MSVLQPPIAAAATPLFARSSDARTDVTESRGADVIEFPATPSRRAAAAEPMSKQKRLLKIAGLAVDALELSLEEIGSRCHAGLDSETRRQFFAERARLLTLVATARAELVVIAASLQAQCGV